MADPEDLDARLRNVERDVEDLKTENGQLRRDVSAARVLAAGADQDVSGMHAAFRAQTMILNALRETQLEQEGRFGNRLDGFDARMDRFDARMDKFDARMDKFGARMDRFELRLDGLETEVRTGFAKMTVGMQHITTLLTTALDNGSLGPGGDRPNNP